MNRDQLLDLCYSADNPAEISRARKARANWLADHPNDHTIIDAGSALSMIEDALNMTASQGEQTFAALPLSSATTVSTSRA